MKVAVIGAGVMGGSIAAYIASLGFKVVLLDIPSNDVSRPNLILEQALQRIKLPKKPLISHPKRLANITIGNLRDDLKLLGDCILVIEAIIEKIEQKWQLFKTITPFLQPECIVASNTSTFTLKLLKSQTSWQKIIITHFFNPIWHMPLVELVSDEGISEQDLKKILGFLVDDLGKVVIKCNDSPGFIANRIGCFFLELAVSKAIAQGLQIEYIDFFACKLLKFPKTAIFGLYDLIGLDVMDFIGSSLTKSLSKHDPYLPVYNTNQLVKQLITQGALGNKTKKGFYQKQDNKIYALNLVTKQYDLALTLDSSTQITDRYTKYFSQLANEIKLYASSIVPEVASSLEQIDQVMELGFNWQVGPSKFIDLMNNSYVAQKLSKSFEDVMVASNDDAKLLSYKNSLIFSLATKMNVLTENVFLLLFDAVKIAQDRSTPLIIYNREKNFSVGADLKFLLFNAKNGNFKKIEDFIRLGQKVMQELKYANVPIIALANNLALGGGCELLLHSSIIITTPLLQAGLVETAIGLIPSWGGLKEMVLRSQGKGLLLIKLLDNILSANKTSSADYFAQDYQVEPIIVAGEQNMLQYAMSLDVTNFSPKVKSKSIIVDKVDMLNGNLDTLDQHMIFILQQIQQVLQKKHLSEQDLLDAEVDIFMQLIKTERVMEKISKILHI